MDASHEDRWKKGIEALSLLVIKLLSENWNNSEPKHKKLGKVLQSYAASFAWHY